MYSHGVGHKLAVVSKDCSVCVYDATSSDLLLIGKTTVVGAAMCCDWSYDDGRLCVALSGGVAGLAVLDAVNFNVLSQEKVSPASIGGRKSFKVGGHEWGSRGRVPSGSTS